LPDSPDRICATYITETNDVFILTQKKREYLLFHICLDESYDETLEEAIARRGRKTGRKKISYKVDRVFKYWIENVDS
jgi:deoxyadenosine/deoxycytidine kinase